VVPDITVADGAAQLTVQAADQVRNLIVRRILLPGEKIRQVELAKRVGVSRSPLREALRTLESEGIVSYEVNRGYVVSRLDRHDMEQIYRMRALLERELLLTITRPDARTVRAIAKHNDVMVQAINAVNVSAMLDANRAFHFAIFDLSPLDLFRREVRRLWQLSEGYRATYLWLPETRARIVSEHAAMVAVLREFDRDQLVELSAQHRRASEDVVVGLLAGS
jgi:DNA-binding GntR family transcriptional regulator